MTLVLAPPSLSELAWAQATAWVMNVAIPKGLASAAGLVGLLVVVVLAISITERLQRWSMGRRKKFPFSAVGAAGLALIVFPFACDFVDYEIDDLHPRRLPEIGMFLLKWALAMVGVLTMAVCYIARGAARSRDVDETLKRDPRGPVLLLRAFADEGSKLVDAGDREKFECALARAAKRQLGPLVALGAPQDFLPRPCAARAYTDDWQRYLRGLAKQARAAIFVIDETMTKNLEKEFGMARRTLEPAQVFMLTYPKKIKSARVLLSDALVRFGVEPVKLRSSAGTLIGFGENWNPSVLANGLTKASEYIAAIGASRPSG